MSSRPDPLKLAKSATTRCCPFERLSATAFNSTAADSGCVILSNLFPSDADARVTSADVIPVRSDLRELAGYHSPQVDVRVRLNTNESPLPPPEAWREALDRELSRIEWNRYPDRMATDLREAIADAHGVSSDMVFAANGSNEVLQTLLLAYGGHGRTVATFSPTYQMHSQIARVIGATVVDGERAADYTLSPVEIDRVVSEFRPDVIFLTSPNNPTGLVEPRERVEQLLRIAPGLIVADEAYAQFASWTALSMLSEESPLVVTRTFSKTWSLAGLRLGYVIGPTWFISELHKVALPYHLDAAKQIAGRLALGFVDEMNDRVSQIIGERTSITAALRAMPIEVFDSEANFILFRPTSISGRDLWQALLNRSVLVRDCSGWPRLGGCLRVTVGTSSENGEFLDAVSEIIGSK